MIREVLDFLGRRRTAYAKTFSGPYADEVLKDLAKFCRAGQSTFHPDARVHAVMEGRREVFLRISEYLQLTDEELYQKYLKQQEPTK
ncbi:hypothetical protein UFOVP158_9 [uncultured Caudovirales phage]|uniref:Bbp19-like phage domain-containing protein n=1 Tax=uncultured Caudovirales phage TaxID=2100421 RepID=A0A6J7WCG5_9CAUD|nr:hypothetical protein UFOVP158_9 [uncultured Caudovirales phage]